MKKKIIKKAEWSGYKNKMNLQKITSTDEKGKEKSVYKIFMSEMKDENGKQKFLHGGASNLEGEFSNLKDATKEYKEYKEEIDQDMEKFKKESKEQGDLLEREIKAMIYSLMPKRFLKKLGQFWIALHGFESEQFQSNDLEAYGFELPDSTFIIKDYKQTLDLFYGKEQHFTKRAKERFKEEIKQNKEDGIDPKKEKYYFRYIKFYGVSDKKRSKIVKVLRKYDFINGLDWTIFGSRGLL